MITAIPQLLKWECGPTSTYAMGSEGTLYFNPPSICIALDATPDALRHVLQRNKDMFSIVRPLSVTICHAKGIEVFLKKHKELFLIQRMRKDLVWYSEDDFIGLCFLMKTDKAKTAQREFKSYIRERRRISYYTEKQVVALKGQVSALEKELGVNQTSLQLVV